MQENNTDKRIKKPRKKRNYLKTMIRCLIIFILILIQIAVILALAYYLNRFAIYVYIVIGVLSVIILLSLISQERNAAYKIYWMGVVLVFPIVGHIMYELWGNEKVNRKSHRAIQRCIDDMNLQQTFHEEPIAKLSAENASNGRMSRYLSNQGFPLYENTKVSYFDIGEKAFIDMEQELAKAKFFICISFFTIADGEIWDKICTILEQKVREGVRVQVMYDDAGSVFQLSDSTVEKIIEKGIEVLRFNPMERGYHRLFLNYRNHQKIVVIDGSVAYTGGINASDRYANIDSPYGHWKDIAVKLEGDAVWSMSLIFLGMWEASGKKEDPETYRPMRSVSGGTCCQPFADGPSNNPANEAMDMFLQMIYAATEEINIMTPYLIIDDTMRDALCIAAKSGVKVTIITPGIPDKKWTKRITEGHYGTLLKAGVRIFEYTPGFVHAKMCQNETSAIIGTINMDFRSFFLHFENGVWIPQGEVRTAIRDDFFRTLLQCDEVLYEVWKKRPLHVRICQWVGAWVKCQF